MPKKNEKINITKDPSIKTKNETTEIVCVIDRSTSIMTSGLTEKTIEGFNAFLQKQKDEVGKAKFTMCLFDGGSWENEDIYEIRYDGVDISEAKELNEENFVPKGMTAMYDAIGVTIDTVHNRIKKSKKSEKPDKVIFLIMTDGQENSSKEYNQKGVFKLINERKKKNNWAFIFIGANIDSMQVGGGLGVLAGNTMNYSNTGSGVETAYFNMSASVSNVRGMNSKSKNFVASLDTLVVDNGEEKEEELNLKNK